MKNVKEGIVVLSLFDGMSCGHLALDEANIKVDKYIASEIKPFAIRHTQEHYPKTIQIGDVTKVYYNKWNKTLYANCERQVIDNIVNHPTQSEWTKKQRDSFEIKHLEVCDDGNVYKWFWKKASAIHIGKIDLLLSGSPCQNFSSAHYFSGGEYGLKGDKSVLFYEFLRILKEVEPRYYFFENVKMKKGSEEELSNYLGTKALHINSNLLTYQNRDRLYWTNIEGITMPKDAQVNFQDYKLKTLPRVEAIIRYNRENEDKKEIRLSESAVNEIPNNNIWAYKELKEAYPHISKEDFVKELHTQLSEATKVIRPFRIKMWDACLNKGQYASKNLDLPTSTKCGALTRRNDRNPSTSGLICFGDFYRYLTKLEMSKAQGVPYSYLNDLNYNYQNDVLGDGWSIPIIAHCLSFMK